MTGDIFGALGLAITSCFGWFQQIMEVLGFTGIILGAFTILTISRFLLKPLVGGGVGKSDRAKKSSSNNSDSKGEDSDG